MAKFFALFLTTVCVTAVPNGTLGGTFNGAASPSVGCSGAEEDCEASGVLQTRIPTVSTQVAQALVTEGPDPSEDWTLGLLQTRILAVSTQVAHALVTEGPDASEDWTLEPFLDFTLAHLTAECHRIIGCNSTSGKGISRGRWMELFTRLDVNGDGLLTADDVNVASRQQASKMVRRLNVTKEQCHEALVELGAWYPLMGPYLIKNVPLLLLVTWTEEPVPAGAPEPDGSAFTAPTFLQLDNEEASALLTECQLALVDATIPAFSLLLAALGVHLPTTNLTTAVRKAVTTNVPLLMRIAGIIKALDGAEKILSHRKSTATFIFRVGKEMWSEGVFKTVLDDVRKSMTFWDWVKIVVPLLASLASFFLTAGTANIVIALAAGGIAVVDLTVALRSVAASCK